MDCEECGFSYDSLTAEAAPDALRGFGKRYRVPLTRGLKSEDLDSLLRAHPLEGTWSALEYACHVRDLLVVQAERVAQARVEDRYSPAPMRRDELVRERAYNEQEVALVADQLAAYADALAEVFTSFAAEEWDRTMIYHDKGERSLLWVAQHTVHEGEHHLLDIGRVLRAARGR